MPQPVPFTDLKERVSAVLADAPSRDAYARILEWRMRVFVVAQLAEFAMLLFCPWWGVTAGCAALFAFYRARTVWTVIHNRVHTRPLPHSFAKLFYDFSTGFVAIWWRAHHLRHHAKTNTADDPDCTLFFGRDMTAATDPVRGPVRRALGLVTTLAQYPVLFVLFFYRSLRSYDGYAVVFLIPMALYGVLLSQLLPADAAALNSGMNLSIGSAYILFTFAATHTAGRHNFERTGSSQLDQLVSTNDVWPRSRLWSFLCGGINLHIEHHLFPHVPSDWLPEVVPVVEDFAAEHQLPYNSYSPWGLWSAHVRFLAGF